MKTVALLFLVSCLLILSGLRVWRQFDIRADRTETERLLALRPQNPPLFSRQMVAELPETARRYFHFTIKDGTPLHTVAEISMRGQFAMGSKANPDYMPMAAEQVLAAPEGFIWKMAGGTGGMKISGSDSASWTRFWLAGIVPVARAGGTHDHTLSGFGRYVAEAVFWAPAAVLPRPGVTWDAVDANTARVTVEHAGMRQSVDITLDEDGRPLRVVLERWSDANADSEFRLQPFGGDLSDFRDFGGFTLPAHVEAGNLYGTDDYFPFFVADVTNIHFQ